MARENYLEDIATEDLTEIKFESLIEALNLRLGLICEQHSPNGTINNCLVNQLKIIRSLTSNIYSNGNGPLLLGLEYIHLKNSPIYKLLCMEENIKPLSIVSTRKLGLKRDKNLVKMINQYLNRGIGIIGKNHLDNKEVIQKIKHDPILIYPFDNLELKDGIYRLDSKKDTYLTVGLI